MYVDSRRSESFEDQSVGWSMRRDVLNSTSNKPNMFLINKGRAVLVDFVLRTDAMLMSLDPDTILGMVFDLTNRYSSPECLLLFLNVPHNIFPTRVAVRAESRLKAQDSSRKLVEGTPPRRFQQHPAPGPTGRPGRVALGTDTQCFSKSYPDFRTSPKDETNFLAFHTIMFLPEGYACAATDRCFLLANCCAPRSGESLPRDAQSYGGPPLSNPHECSSYVIRFDRVADNTSTDISVIVILRFLLGGSNYETQENKIMSPEESTTTCSIASQISTIAQFVCNVARCAKRDLSYTRIQLGRTVGPSCSSLSGGKPHGKDPLRSWNRARFSSYFASALITVHLTPREKPTKTEALKRRHGNEDRFTAHGVRGWTSKKKVEPNCTAALRHVQRYLSNSLSISPSDLSPPEYLLPIF
ncbi:hypothetical protein G5I_06099 [Acromyrmex echinatior]|uniref:Uncharacterized protein n=1 Tax=Acromyrmex echinatior TaxID=103372 RepID=F4WK56_ACREC|nr:hypothetical protein G5I_06099 [Acromyrmex echinatior]